MNDITKNAKNSPNKPFVHLKYRKLRNGWFCYCACRNIWFVYTSNFTKSQCQLYVCLFMFFTYVWLGILFQRFATYTVISSDVLQDLRLHRCWKIDDDNNKVQQHNDDHRKRFLRCKRCVWCDTDIQLKRLLRQTSFILVVYTNALHIFRDLVLCIYCITRFQILKC